MPTVGRARGALALLLALLTGFLLAHVLGGRPQTGDHPLGHRSGTHAGENVRRESVLELAGRAERARGQPPAGKAAERIRERDVPVSGIVLDNRGRPIPRALVYMIPKGIRGVDDIALLPNVPTNEDGEFLIGRPGLADHSLCAIAEGFLPAGVDGAAIRPRERVTLQLDVGGLIVVSAPRASGGLGPTTYVRVDSARSRSTARFPAPGTNRNVHVLGKLTDGDEIALRVGTDGPVVVSATRWGHFSIPAEIQLERPVGQVEFAFQQSCGLHIRVADKETTDPITAQISLDVVDQASGKLINGAISTSPYGEFELRDRLPPGLYTIRVRVEGWKEWAQQSVRLIEPGKRVELIVGLERQPDHDRGKLRVALPDLSIRQAGLAEGRYAPVVVCIRRMEADDTGAWSMAENVRNEAPGNTLLIERLKSGTYDVLIWDQIARTVGISRGTRVNAQVTTPLTVSLIAGTDVHLRESVPVATQIASIDISSGLAPSLPIVRIAASGVVLYDDAMPTSLDTLGPFPGDGLQVTVLDEVGKRHQFGFAPGSER